MSAQLAADLRAAARRIREGMRVAWALNAVLVHGPRYVACRDALEAVVGSYHEAIWLGGDARGLCALERAASLAAPPRGHARVALALSTRHGTRRPEGR